MALMNCPNCGHMVSDLAPKCPECGATLKVAQVSNQNVPTKTKQKDSQISEMAVAGIATSAFGVVVLLASFGIISSTDIISFDSISYTIILIPIPILFFILGFPFSVAGACKSPKVGAVGILISIIGLIVDIYLLTHNTF